MFYKIFRKKTTCLKAGFKTSFKAGAISLLMVQLSCFTGLLPAAAQFEPESDWQAALPATQSDSPEDSQWIAAQVDDLKQSSQQWIQINLDEQRLTAWEGSTPVFSVVVSTGRVADQTPTGVYAIQDKYRTARMQGEHQGTTYDIPDVPYTMYFSGSYAIHGAYWHDNFGTPVSSGCINVPTEAAAWLFGWAGVGTSVIVQN
jgi:lipoprotein-anchoring transpeptidase ErfK/SrfK